MAELITLRPVNDSDQPFLLDLLASTRPELSLLEGPAREMMLRLQYNAQLTHYRRQFPAMEANVVLADGVPAGRLYLARSATEIRLIDISLLPAFRRQRIGGSLLAGLQEESARTGVPLRLHVLSGNQAQALYQRLGFLARPEGGMYRQMEWNPTL